MTVKELKEKLNKFDDNLLISAKHISRGLNEADGCVFISDYVEDD